MSQVSGQAFFESLLKVGLTAGTWYALRAVLSRSVEELAERRLSYGKDGIVSGAGEIRLEAGENSVLLLHGFGDTPQSLAFIAGFLHSHGWTVRVPLLPGHGRTLRAFARSSAECWLAEARASWEQLLGRGGRVALVGQSMGGALAALLAADGTPPPSALVLLAPYLFPPRSVRVLARSSPVVRILSPYVPSASRASIEDPVARGESLGHRFTPLRLLPELCRLADMASAVLPRITSPTLLIQSPRDNRLSQAAAERAIALLGAADKKLEWVEGGHVVSVDSARALVAEAALEWLDRH